MGKAILRAGSGFADPRYFAQELCRVVAVFEHLVANYVVEFLVRKRQGFGRCVDQLLVGEYTQAAAAVGVVAEEFLHEYVRSERRTIAGPNFEYPVSSFDVQILPAFGGADFHGRTRIVANIGNYFYLSLNMRFTSFHSPSLGAGSMPSSLHRMRYMFWFWNEPCR